MTNARARRPYEVHPSFTPATVRGVLPRHPENGAEGVSFDIRDGTVLRLWLDAASVEFLIESLLYYRDLATQTVQSDNSSGSPASDGSSEAGQSVCPPTSSSSAEDGDG